MKKTSNKRINIFKPFIRFFDKYLISPITKLILFIGDTFKSNDKGFEKILNNRQALVIISLIFALITFYAIDQESVSLIDDNAEIISGIPVNAVYNQEAYVIEGLPESVDITLIGKKQNVYLAKQYPADQVVVDLSDLTPGTHKVDLNYKQNVSSVTYKVDPSTVTVVVYKKMSEIREVSSDIIHKDSLDSKFNIDTVTLSKDKVTIKGPEYKLSQVASVKALIDVNNLTNQKKGKQKLKEIKLVAYNSEGNPVDIEIVPETLEAEIVINDPHKEVPIIIETEGELDGKAIKSLSPSVQKVVLYGPQEVLDNIESLPVSIDISGINSDKNYTINLTKPTGVRDLSINTINVKLIVDEIISKDINGITVQAINKCDYCDPQAFNPESQAITVIVKGSQSIIDSLDPAEDIEVTVDISGLTPRAEPYELPVKVVGKNSKLTYTARNPKVKIIIFKK